MQKALIIYGPTATGKTDIAIKLAKKLNGELISADSRQVYQKLDIGSGKVNFDSIVERHNQYWIVDGVKVYGFDLVDPETDFTVANFLKFAETASKRITDQNKLPIIVGGTGFYIKSITDGLGSIGIPANKNLRVELEKLSKEDLFKKLSNIDPERVKRMNESDRRNPRRLIRAIEIILSVKKMENKKINGKWKLENGKFFIIGLTAPNEFLYARADKWLNTRLKHGMIEEVNKLMKINVDQKWLDSLGLEYRWISRYLLGNLSKEEALERLKGDIHGFIRRQKTWFKKFDGIKLYDISKAYWQKQLEKTVGDWYNQANDGRKSSN